MSLDIRRQIEPYNLHNIINASMSLTITLTQLYFMIYFHSEYCIYLADRAYFAAICAAYNRGREERRLKKKRKPAYYALGS